MNRKTYINNFGRKLKSWDREIAKLEKKAEKITQTLHKRIDAVRQQRENAAAKSTDLLHSSEEAWVEIKNGAEVVMNDLKKTFRKAKAKFN